MHADVHKPPLRKPFRLLHVVDASVYTVYVHIIITMSCIVILFNVHACSGFVV